jgi:hypothetical protein
MEEDKGGNLVRELREYITRKSRDNIKAMRKIRTLVNLRIKRSGIKSAYTLFNKTEITEL